MYVYSGSESGVLGTRLGVDMSLMSMPASAPDLKLPSNEELAKRKN